jgi:hypothetical protein
MAEDLLQTVTISLRGSLCHSLVSPAPHSRYRNMDRWLPPRETNPISV